MSSSPFVDRRLRAIIVRDEHDQIVVTASPSDIRNFAPVKGQEVTMRPPMPAVRMQRGGRIQNPVDMEQADGVYLDMDDYLYDRHGRPVAMMDRVTVDAGVLDVTTMSGGRQFAQGMVTVNIEARGLPGVVMR